MKTLKGCCAAVAGGALLIFLAFVLFVMNYNYGWVDQETTKPVRSPDGRYSAYIGMRGALDSVHSTIRLRKGEGKVRGVMEVYGSKELKWSPNSQRLAVVDCDGYAPAAGVYVYDVKGRQKACGYCNIPELRRTAQSTNIRLSDEWQWKGPNTIVIHRFVNDVEKCAVKVAITNQAGKLTLEDAKGKVLNW